MSSTNNENKLIKLGNNLRKLRFEHNELSQLELANAVGVTRLTIHSIETGKFNPSVFLALKIAKFFDRPLEDVFFIYYERSRLHE
jgi:putative transcriptional regulator